MLMLALNQWILWVKTPILPLMLRELRMGPLKYHLPLAAPVTMRMPDTKEWHLGEARLIVSKSSYSALESHVCSINWLASTAYSLHFHIPFFLTVEPSWALPPISQSAIFTIKLSEFGQQQTISIHLFLGHQFSQMALFGVKSSKTLHTVEYYSIIESTAQASTEEDN